MKKKNSFIPYSRHYCDKNDIKNLINALKSNYISQGPKQKEFANNLRKITKSKYVTVLNSATSALHTACASLGLKKNDILWTVPITWPASANCGLYCGAKIDFVDIDEITYNICTKKLLKKLIYSKKKKTLPKILVVVHLAGNPCDLKKIKNLSKKFKFKIIEDASHALGSFYNNMPIGNPKYSDAVVTSFGPLKSITSAEGGAIFTNNKKNYIFNEIFRQSGVQKNKDYFYLKNKSYWWNEQQVLGYNYKLSELHASLGISQLKKLKLFVKKRNKLSEIYEKKLCKKIRFQKSLNKNFISARHIFIIRVNKSLRSKLFNFLIANNIGASVNYIPIYKYPYYKKVVKVNLKHLKESENYYSEAISIPLFYGMTKLEHSRVINVINKFFDKYL